MVFLKPSTPRSRQWLLAVWSMFIPVSFNASSNSEGVLNEYSLSVNPKSLPATGVSRLATTTSESENAPSMAFLTAEKS